MFEKQHEDVRDFSGRNVEEFMVIITTMINWKENKSQN